MRPAGPEILFRIVHSAVPNKNRAPLATYREQEVEVAFGPMGIIEECDIGTLKRRIEADQVVSVFPLTRVNLKPQTDPKTPRVTELLRMAIKWRQQLDVGEGRNQAAIARREGITRARVTQVMSLLRLAPEIQQRILSTPKMVSRSPISERMLRPIETIADYHTQIQEFHKLSS